MIIQELSGFLTDLNYEDISQQSIEKAKLCFLDYLSVYFRGLETQNSKIAIKTVYGLFGGNFNLLNTGFINGITSHSLDLDDGHRVAQLHPGTVVFSTALAMISDDSIARDLSSKEFLEAVIGGYETAIILGMLVNPNHRNQGFHSTGTIGSIAAAAVASKLLRLDLSQTEHCLGLATTQASGLLEADHAGTMGKSLHVGNAVYNGILSAYLSNNGFTGGESLIDGKEGFLKAMVSDLDEYNGADEDSFANIDQFLENNMGKFHIGEVYFKKYPFCRHIHSAIDSSLVLKEDLNSLFLKNNLDFDSIESIDVKTYKIASEHDNYNPKTPQDLKQSLPYAIAISLVLNDLSLDSIDNLIDNGLFDDKTNQKSNDSNGDVLKIRNLVKKINIIYDEDLDLLTPDKRPAQIKINFNNDTIKELEDSTYYPLGEMENPLREDDILDKFRLLNPKFNMDKLQIINHMEDYPIMDVLKELDLMD